MQEQQKALKVWRTASARMREQSEQCFQQWFKPLVPVRIDGGNSLVLGIPNDFFGEILSRNYSDLLTEILAGIDGVDYSYTFEEGHKAPAEAGEEQETAAVQPEVRTAAAESGHGNSMVRHTFENFVVSEANRYAYMTVKSAVECPGMYNPLYIFGSSGTGKTHLLRAAAHMAGREMRVKYASCGELLDDFYNLLQNKRSLSEFRSSVRDVDMLLVDDVHVLANKTQMQEEFFKMFNALYLQGKQIILTSDKQPCEIKGLEPRLVTRFESGVTTEIAVPEVEGRLTILRMLRDDTLIKVKLGDNLLEFLAQQISSSVRRLKGAFMRLAAFASMSGEKLTIRKAEELLAAQLAQETSARVVTMEAIQHAVADQFGIKVADILGSKRPKNIAEPRLVAMYLSRQLTGHSFPEIGAAFGKTHGTVINAVSKVPELCAKDESLRRAVQQLELQLKRG